jgi:deoxycytidine triphosphate deaminase
MNLKDYPVDDNDALARADLFERKDPFESVPRALLSTAEIDDYAKLTGMLSPYYPKHLKSASYEAHIGGEVIWWDETGKKYKHKLERGGELILKANSIVFVQVEPIFRLPYYIAIRFNLRITHVHRGLLLGTGPLVDPGFRGKLLIPLHNLTATEYAIDTREALIWIEFTKTSYGCEVTDELASTDRKQAAFPKDKQYLEPETYLRKANGANSIRSSIPDAMERARGSAEAAKQEIESLKKIGLWGGLVAALTILFTVLGLYYQMGQMIQNAGALVSSVQQTVVPLSGDLKVTTNDLKATSGDLKTTSDRVTNAQAQIDRLTQQIEQLSRDTEALKSESSKRTSN